MLGRGISIPEIHKTADSINVIVGGLTGTVADIQTWQDGNILQLAEVAATPGLDMELNFVDVESIRRIGLSMYYNGSSTHWIEVLIWDYVTMEWKTIWTFNTDGGLNYRYSDLPADSDNNFIDAGGNAKMRIVHPAGGNAAHDAFFDYVGLIS